jgi:hypothetical protein
LIRRSEHRRGDDDFAAADARNQPFLQPFAGERLKGRPRKSDRLPGQSR